MPQLNPTLYQALQAAFGSVSVTNDLQPRQVLTLPDWQDGGRLRSQVVASGEQYRVNCPYCGDERQRLYFNYEWAVPDSDGHDNLHLVKCFNENCLASRERQRDLLNRVYPLGRERLAGIGSAIVGAAATPFVPSCPMASWCPWTGYLTRIPQAHTSANGTSIPPPYGRPGRCSFASYRSGHSLTRRSVWSFPSTAPTSIWQVGRPAMWVIALTACPNTCRARA